MTFVTTHPEALAAAAGTLQGIGSAMAAQNAAAAAPTTGVVPAAADEVSALQATQFAAYGALYQQVSAQATAIHEMFVHTLGISAGSYGETETANSVAAGTSSGLSGLLGGLGTSSSSGSGPLSWLTDLLGGTGPGGLSGNLSNILNIGTGNWASAGSNLLGMAGGGLFDAPAEVAADAESGGLAGGLDGTLLAGVASPTGTGGIAAPVSAAVGQASSVGMLSVPPSWAGPTGPVSGATPATLTGAGWTGAAPHSTPVSTMPAGMPSAASAGRGGFGFGAPRYGVKPTVMPKPAVV
ncbi:PE family protein [Mycobacterium kyorinense]|uniref:PE family protein n=2 Tax=Mycobacterium kyorinense TaxID=487514 RepID=A0A1A2YZD5_9MYCO|nr:PE family protein [Mycobacterium kyorinense]